MQRIIEIYNEYVEEINCYDDTVYGMEMFDYHFHGASPLDIIRNVDRDFNTMAEYFMFDGYRYVSLFDEIDVVNELDNHYIDSGFHEYVLDNYVEVVEHEEIGPNCIVENSPLEVLEALWDLSKSQYSAFTNGWEIYQDGNKFYIDLDMFE